MSGDTTMLHLQNADERDDWGVPLIRTYSPERARMGTDTDNVYPAIGPVKGGSTRMSGDMTMLHLQNADERDDWGVPLIRTYSPERAQMGTDTDNVYPAIGPVKGGSTRMLGDTTMLHLQNADERDDCGVPMERSHIADERDDWGVPRIRTYSPERARMGTDTDRVCPPIVPVEGVCIFCSVTSYSSTSSR